MGLVTSVVVLTSCLVEIRHILCPIEVSEISEFALTYSAMLAQTLGAKVTALHVVQSAPGVLLEDGGVGHGSAALPREEERELREMVERCAKGSELRLVLQPGTAAAHIVDQAKQLHADVIAIGTHGRSGLKHLLLGSVAERVLRTSTVPVMTLRKPGATQED
jgi:nucleotide-binding universal stress UspA family protein